MSFFDVPGALRESPKEIEQYRRDKTTENSSQDHHCIAFSSDLLVPDKWRAVLACRTCKKKLTAYVADDMLTIISHSLQPHQKFVANVGETTFSIAHRQSRCLRTDLHTNADEADIRIWLHCKNSCGTRKLVFSPDYPKCHTFQNQR